MRAHQTLAIALGIGLCALAAPARGQDVASAKVLFNQGLTDMQAGNFEKGCPELEASYKLDPRPGTLFTLATCEANRGRLATAAARYDDYLAMFDRLSVPLRNQQGARRQTAEQQRATLGPQVPELTLFLPANAPRETVVKRDGTPLAGAALGLALPVDPGEHLVTTQVPGGEVTEIRVSLEKGEKKQVTLPVKDAMAAAPAPAPAPAAPLLLSAPPAAPPPADQGPSGRRVGALVVGGVGVAGLILGGVMGAMTLGKKGVIEQNCNVGGEKRACNDAGLAAAGDAKTLGLVSTIGFGVGIAGVGAAVALVLTEPARPRRAAAPARWVSAGVLSAGAQGITVGLQGVW